MNLPKNRADQISRYYEDLEKNGKELDPALTDTLEQEALYERVRLGIIKHDRARLSFRRLIGAVAIILVLFGLSITFYQQFQQREPEQVQVVMQTAVAAKGRVVQLSLADGTQIWLNSGSKLIYPATFSGRTRSVSLEGEAYFQVAHDASRPFLIRSGQMMTKVLGTSFNIKAYKEDRNIRLAVLTGKVRVSLPSANKQIDSVSLMPNQLVTFNKEKKSIVLGKVENTANLISWREGRLHYDEVPLRSVIADLQRKYDVEIHVTPALERRRITADFRDESIKKVMIVLSEMTGSTVVETQKGYRLR